MSEVKRKRIKLYYAKGEMTPHPAKALDLKAYILHTDLADARAQETARADKAEAALQAERERREAAEARVRELEGAARTAIDGLEVIAKNVCNEPFSEGAAGATLALIKAALSPAAPSEEVERD